MLSASTKTLQLSFSVVSSPQPLPQPLELMKQPQYSPLTNAEIVCVIFAGTNGYLDGIGVNEVGRYEAGLISHLRNNHADLLSFITNDDPKIKGDAEAKIRAALDEYAADFA